MFIYTEQLVNFVKFSGCHLTALTEIPNYSLMPSEYLYQFPTCC